VAGARADRGRASGRISAMRYTLGTLLRNLLRKGWDHQMWVAGTELVPGLPPLDGGGPKPGPVSVDDVPAKSRSTSIWPDEDGYTWRNTGSPTLTAASDADWPLRTISLVLLTT